MMHKLIVGTVLGIAMAMLPSSRADDQATSTAVIERHLKAVGGEEKLAKIKAATWKDKGKFFGLGDEGIDYTAETSALGTTKRKMSIQGEVANEKFSVVIVVSGDKGWTKTEDEVEDMDKEELDEQKEQMFADWTAFINPSALKTDAFKLSPLGEIKIEDRPMIGVKATAKGRRDMNLYFDKETGLLRKTEWQVKDTDGNVGGGEVQQEVLLSEYKDFDGVKVATKVSVKWAGKPYVESEQSDFQFHDKLDDAVFAKPD
jgi:hypothetical protein